VATAAEPVLTGVQAAEAEPERQSKPKAASEQESKQEQPERSKQEGEWLFAPIPINSPAIGAGLEWAVARVFPFSKNDEVSPPSAIGIAGVFTNNGSTGVAVGGRVYLKEDKYRLAFGVGTASINFDIYGIGQESGDQGVYVPLNTDGAGFIVEFLHRLRKGIYFGARGQYRNVALSLNQEDMDSSEITDQPPEDVAAVIDQIREQFFRQQTASIGPRFQWDSRDNVFYPRQGLLTEVATDFFAEGLGSNFSYQYYKVSFNKYNKFGDHQVLAVRGMGCAAAGDRVPIYDLCLFGTSNDLRGYPGGRFQDRRMFATQAEYRLMFPFQGIWGRFGVVAFGGVGAIGAKFSDIGANDLLPAGGGGVRFRLLKKYPINFRVDYGIGKVGQTLSIGVLEAF
jgi:outer membrane protein assembly factor BamA